MRANSCANCYLYYDGLLENRMEQYVQDKIGEQDGI